MIFYLTFNDAPSGIFSSQVIDVVKFLRNDLDAPIKLVSFISLRNFSENKKKILSDLPDAIVLPMVPGVKRWRMNSFFLKRLCKKHSPSLIIGRSVLATQLAFKCGTTKIVYDGRGAIAAEWKEYGVVRDPKMLSEISLLEKECVNRSDFRIAVSAQLVNYWEQEYAYSKKEHVIIPCTANKVFEELALTGQTIADSRKRLGIEEESIVLTYAGSVAGWQSFSLLYNTVKPLLSAPNFKLLFISPPDDNIAKLQSEFPGKIIVRSVPPAQVPELMMAGDYGLLIREESITNQVASPVKFAEYLACGLMVIISENLGDYTSFVIKNKCGHLNTTINNLQKTTLQQKQLLRIMANAHFFKKNFVKQYSAVVN